MTKLYVRNLETHSTQQTVRSLFETYGTVERIRMNKNTGAPRTNVFAFVEMQDAQGADRAIQALHGSGPGPVALHVIKARAARTHPRQAAD